MMMKKYSYADVRTSSCGLMICSACNKSIVAGQYRYRETSEKYITIHRACCQDDRVWAKLDGEAAARRQSNIDLLAACIQFRDKWQVGELDELITDLQEAQLQINA